TVSSCVRNLQRTLVCTGPAGVRVLVPCVFAVRALAPAPPPRMVGLVGGRGNRNQRRGRGLADRSALAPPWPMDSLYCEGLIVPAADRGRFRSARAYGGDPLVHRDH